MNDNILSMLEENEGRVCRINTIGGIRYYGVLGKIECVRNVPFTVSLEYVFHGGIVKDSYKICIVAIKQVDVFRRV